MSITLEDTFNDYGLSVWRYVENDDDIEYIICDEGRIQPQQMISNTKMVFALDINQKTFKTFSSRIVPKTIYENLKTKHYIHIGDECPICYEPIIHKHTAFLTECGHAFHYKCILDYDYHNSLAAKAISECPICKQDMGYFPELKNRYFNTYNAHDRLENANINMHISNPKVCVYCHKVYGFNKNCHNCKQYLELNRKI